MVAIVTNGFKQFNIDYFKQDYDSSDNRYYIAIGRSEDWNSGDTPPEFLAGDELQSLASQRKARLALQSGKIINNFSRVVPRYNWVANSIYSSYDDARADIPDNSYYVLTDENQVYICLHQGKDGGGQPTRSTVKPTGTSVYPITLDDGYIWKFAYTISALDTDKYVTTQFMPVQYIDSAGDDAPATSIQQKTIQDYSVEKHQKSIVDVVIENNGAGSYPPSTTQSVEIRGNGTGAAATATIDANGNIINVTMDDSSNGDKKFGSGYDYAEAIVGGGGTGSVRPVLSPLLGIGGNPIQDFRCNSVMFNVKMENAEGGTILADNDFRQIVLLKNPEDAVGAAFTQTSGLFLNKLSISNRSGGLFEPDDIIESTEGSPTARAVVDYFDAVEEQIWYHQNDSTGFAPFQGSQSLTNNQGVTAETLAINFDSAAEINKFSGELFYIDNRAAVDRSSEQTEDIKVVIRY